MLNARIAMDLYISMSRNNCLYASIAIQRFLSVGIIKIIPQTMSCLSTLAITAELN